MRIGAEMLKKYVAGVLLGVSSFVTNATAYEEHFAVNVDPAVWQRSIDTVKKLLQTKRVNAKNQNNADIYSDDVLNLITPENVTFQGEAVWLDISLGYRFKNPERRKEAVFDRLQSSASLEKSNQFLEQYCYTLGDSYEECRVTPEIIAGIGSIETFFGSFDNVPKFHVLSTLVTWVALQDASLRASAAKDIFRAINADETNKIIAAAEIPKAAFWTSHMLSRSTKSIVQLRDFLNVAERCSWNSEKTLRLMGSWVGAFTDFQFMPKTYRALLVADETCPDPENLESTIPLVARYLKPFWGRGSEKEIRYAIKQYNTPYWYYKFVRTTATNVQPRARQLMSERALERSDQAQSEQ